MPASTPTATLSGVKSAACIFWVCSKDAVTPLSSGHDHASTQGILQRDSKNLRAIRTRFVPPETLPITPGAQRGAWIGPLSVRVVMVVDDVLQAVRGSEGVRARAEAEVSAPTSHGVGPVSGGVFIALGKHPMAARSFSGRPGTP